MYGSLDINVSEHVSFVRHGRTRLSLVSPDILKVPLCKTKTYQASYFNRIVKLWNIISKEVSPRSFTSPTSFKCFLFAKYAKLLDTVFDVDFTCTWSLAPDCTCQILDAALIILLCLFL